MGGATFGGAAADISWKEGAALQTTAIQDFSVLIQWDHFEEFLSKTLLATSDTFPSFLALAVELFLGHDGPGDVEIGANGVHGEVLIMVGGTTSGR